MFAYMKKRKSAKKKAAKKTKKHVHGKHSKKK